MSAFFRVLAVVVALLMSTGFVAEAVVLEDDPAATGAIQVMLTARGEEMELVDMATGLPADAPSLADVSASVGGTIQWALQSDQTDTLGIRHVVYQQHLRFGAANPTGFDAGVPLAGGKLTYRYRRDGVLQSVNGGFFRDVSSLGTIAAASVADARALSGSVLAGTTGLAVTPDALVSEEGRARLQELTSLRLRSEGDGRTFSYVWTVPFHLENDGGAIAAAIDAGTGTVHAIWKTYQTMDTFKDYGRNSFDGLGTTAKIVVDASCGGNYDNAFFNSIGLSSGPTDGVVICPQDPDPTGWFDFSVAAAIDVVAHEWGHGLMFSKGVGTDIWLYAGEGASYHEGSAMIISHIVEHKQEPPLNPLNPQPETAEWKDVEDAREDLEPVRQLDVDDGEEGYSYHLGDWYSGIGAHELGFRLPVAFMLAAVGGVNPVCSRLSHLELDGCDIPSVPSVGIDKASAILFRTLTTYVDETTGWFDFGRLAKMAAHDLYSVSGPPGQCDAALEEQLSMHEAFHAIGLEPPSGSFVCFCSPSECSVAWPY
jgi:hypothetical protein